MKSEHGKAAKSQGTGPSRTFAAPSGTFTEPPALTVDGQPIPAHLAHLIAYEQTDQGRAERWAKGTQETARVKVTADAHDKKLAQYRDVKLENEPTGSQIEPWEAVDPRADLVKRHVPSDHVAHFLNPQKCATDGTRGWTPVKDEHGNDVKLGEMVLASMSKERADKKRAFLHQKALSRIQESTDQIREHQEQLLRETGVPAASRRSFLEPTPEDRGLQVEDVG